MVPEIFRKEISTVPASVGLLLARIFAGGALIFAGILKVKGGAYAFMLNIEGFHMVPKNLLPVTAHFLPWLEIVVGLALLLGIWTRQSAAICVGLYAVFLFGISSVLARGIPADCGCFGDFFGSGEISWVTVVRNIVFVIVAALPLIFGGGLFSLMKGDGTHQDSPKSLADSASISVGDQPAS